MKRLALAAVLSTAVAASAAQQTLVQNGYWEFSLKPECELTRIADSAVGIAGIQGGPSLNRNLYIGLGWYTLVSGVSFDGANESGNLNALDLWYAGVDIDYTFLPDSVVHGSLDVLLGGGKINADLDNGDSDRADVFVAEPGVNLIVNAAPDIELGVGAGYRVISGSGIDGLGDSDLSGPFASIFFRWTESRGR